MHALLRLSLILLVWSSGSFCAEEINASISLSCEHASNDDYATWTHGQLVALVKDLKASLCEATLREAPCSVTKDVEQHQEGDSQNEVVREYEISSGTQHPFKGGRRSREQTYDALMVIYENLGGDQWVYQNNWGQRDVSFCYWHGVFCEPYDPEFEEVTRLFIKNNNLRGKFDSIKHALEGLPFLQSIDLSSNYLEGTIPELIMPTLMGLELSRNYLQGSLPTFASCPSLRSLLLVRNQISGSLPVFENAYLERINLENNILSGLLTTQNSPSFVEIRLGYNLLQGQLDPDMSLPKLRSYDLGSNTLFGTVPDFKFLPSLEALSVSTNFMTGTIPNFSRMPNFMMLTAMVNELEGSIPSFDYCPILLEVMVAINRLSGNLPTFNGNPFLLKLGVARNGLSGLFPSEMSLSTLSMLSIFGNQLQGSLPDLNKFPLLELYLVYENLFSGTIPFSYYTALDIYDVSNNQLTGDIPTLAWSMTNEINLANNHLQGTLPDFVSCAQLNYLDVSGNQLVGSIPIFDNLTDLTILNLSSNKFTIFEGLAEIPIFSLDVSSNKLSGSLPKYLPIGMAIVNFSNNTFTGTFPDTYSLATQLILFRVNANKMRGIDKESPLPEYMTPVEESQQLSTGQLYSCPVIKAYEETATVEMDPDYYHFLYCRCLPGTFGRGNACIACSEACECPGGQDMDSCWPSANSDGVFVDTIPCPYEGACVVGFGQESYCLEGYEDRLCSKCSHNYQLSGNSCVKCETGLSVSVFVAMIAGFCLLITYLIKMPPSDTGLVKIVLFHLQTLSILSANVLDLGVSFSWFLDASTSPSNAVLPAKDCIYGSMPEYFQLVTKIVLLILLSSVLVFCHTGREKWIKVNLGFICLFFLNSMYYGVSQDVFGTFGCVLYDEGEEAWYLSTFPWIQCKPVSHEYSILLGLGLLLFFCYTLLFPVFVIWILRRKALKSKDDTTLRRYGFLYLPYKDEYYYWEVLVICRRLLIAIVLETVPYTNPPLLSILIFAILQVSIVLQHFAQPFKSPQENRLELVSLYVILFSFFIGYVSTLQNLGGAVVILLAITNSLFVVAAMSVGKAKIIRMIGLATSFAARLFGSNMNRKVTLQRNERPVSVAFSGVTIPEQALDNGSPLTAYSVQAENHPESELRLE
eukprot:TRINITY_DN11240_c0_g1_i1.p1 TRINITY_DN11240_c0_g1~~TRINITY_DN11240_c0_g1_i1.p1  ORF type:complete len:1147 (+),score=192.58 TRINITY_DN11240_c0_g1_i1:94-3534(+)